MGCLGFVFVTLILGTMLERNGLDRNLALFLAIVAGIITAFVFYKLTRLIEGTLERMVDKGFNAVENKYYENKNKKIDTEFRYLKDLYRNVNYKNNKVDLAINNTINNKQDTIGIKNEIDNSIQEGINNKQEENYKQEEINNKQEETNNKQEEKDVKENVSNLESNTTSKIIDNCRKVNEFIEQLNKTESKESKESKESVHIEDLDKEVKAEVVNLNASIPKAVISQAIARNVETDNKIKTDKKESDIKVKDTKPKANSNANTYKNSKNENVKVVKYYINEKQKKQPALKTFKVIIFGLIKILLIVILFFVLINFNGKYKITESPIIQKIYTTIDNTLSNILQIKSAPPISIISDFNMVEEPNSNDDNNKNVDDDSNNNYDGKTNISNQKKSTVKIEKNATKITAKVRKLGKTIATWEYNKTKGVWNLYVGKKKNLAKDVVYIIDYTSPVTGEACSSTYYFDKDGKLVTGWGIDEKGDYYYFNDDQYDIGKMCTGWKTIDGDEYYFASNGKLLTDTTTPDGKYVDINGKKQ